MLKKLIALILICSLLVGCAPIPTIDNNEVTDTDIIPNFTSLRDPDLLQYVEDTMYSNLIAKFNSEDYIIEDITAAYVSQEYLDDMEFNSQSNVYFGYTLQELESQFQGARYVFTLGEDGKTVVKEFSAYDDTYDRALMNVAVGTGLILICVTVSVVSGGAGAPAAVSMIFSSAAKTGATYALSSGALSAVASATITGIQTGNLEEAKKAAVLAGSESFKWGAITGVVTGGVSQSVKLYRSSRSVHTPRESELTVLDRTKGAKEQLAYKDGKQVAYNAKDATRPDVVVQNADGTINAIEVKNYNFAQSSNKSTMLSELERQVTSRVQNLPAGSTQEIVLDVRGRNYSKELINNTIAEIKNRLSGVYSDIPVSVMSY